MLTRKSSNGRPVPKLVIGIHQIRRRNLGGALRHRFLDKQESVYFLLETNLVTLCIFFNILMKCSAYRMQRLACSCRMTNTRGSHWTLAIEKGFIVAGMPSEAKVFSTFGLTTLATFEVINSTSAHLDCFHPWFTAHVCRHHFVRPGNHTLAPFWWNWTQKGWPYGWD